MKTHQKIIAYIRVSTKGQEASGLGLEAQQHAIEQFRLSQQGATIREFREIETGKKADRPELAKALAHAKRTASTLVIAKLDRLARNVLFTATLMESGVEFVACDNPHANRLTIHILAAVAEDEARRISQRTKDALAAYKARGGKLGAAREGTHRFTAEESARARTRSAAVRRRKAIDAYADLLPRIVELRREGRSLKAVAEELNTEGQTTRQGKSWTGVQVMRLLRRTGMQ
jgi:DNA invertase Pin-like site-specific DNA recombinase